MLININGTEHNVPSDVSQISLGKFVEWYDTHGRTLDEELTAIIETSDEPDIDLSLHIDKEALSWYSFFTGFDFFKCEDIELTDILLQYRILRDLIKESENESREFPASIDWNEEKWAIQDYRVVPGSLMSFNEVITGKEVIRQISKIGKGKWEALAYLCCIYLRKENELYSDDLLERVELMNTLPLNHALSVAFFLSSSISIFKQHLLSSIPVEEVKQQ